MAAAADVGEKAKVADCGKGCEGNCTVTDNPEDDGEAEAEDGVTKFGPTTGVPLLLLNLAILAPDEDMIADFNKRPHRIADMMQN